MVSNIKGIATAYLRRNEIPGSYMSGTENIASLQEKKKSKAVRTQSEEPNDKIGRKEVSNVTNLLSWAADFRHLTMEILEPSDGCNFLYGSYFFIFFPGLIQKKGWEKALVIKPHHLNYYNSSYYPSNHPLRTKILQFHL